MRAAISILTATAVKQAKWCLQNLKNNTFSGDYRLILTANGPIAVDLFEQFQAENPDLEITIIKNETNEGFIEPNRKALKMVPYSEGNIFIMLNDDALVSEGWLDEIFRAFKANPKLAACGPKGARLRDDFRGGLPSLGKPDYIEGSCLAVRSDFANQVGFFDSNLKLAYGEDSDLCLSLRKAGYQIKELDFAFAHIGSATTKSLQSKELMMAFNDNHRYLRSKWVDYLINRNFP
jgi:GT2 family glycosyltransferase